MRRPLNARLSPIVGAGLAAASLMAASPPAAGQTVPPPPTTVEELIVVGHLAPAEPKRVFSYKVGFADLDLRTEPARAELARRISVTARYVCKRLAATDNRPDTFDNCRRSAIDGAQAKARKAAALARKRTEPFVPGPTWMPPPGEH
jgi:UrcA family protein